METAQFIKEMNNFKGDARLYKLSKPIHFDDEKTNYVIVSGANAMFSGPETYIFPSDKDGKILDWGELPGSFRGSIDHETAMLGAGFEIIGEIADRGER